MAKRLALLIGYTAYEDSRLAAPQRDADLTALAEALRHPQHGRFHAVHLLTNQTAVDAQLAIAPFLEQPLDPDDLLLLYVSGHCLFVEEEALLAASDTFSEPYLDATTIQAEFFRRRLRQCPARALLLLDLVHSRLDGAPQPEADRLLERAFAAPEYALLLAGRAAQQTAPAHGFTQALTAGLRQPAGDGAENGRFTLHNWFAAATARGAKAQKQATPAQDDWTITAVIPAKPASPLPPPLTRRPTRLLLALLALGLLLFGLFWLLPTFGDRQTGSDELAAPPITAVSTATATATSPPSPTPTSATNLVAAATMTATPLPATPEPTPTAPSTPPPPPTATPSPAVTPTASQTPTASPSPTPTLAPLPMEIMAEAAFLRSGPGINYKILGFPLRGTGVTAVARSGDAAWYSVILPDGQTGWIYTDVVRPADAAAGAELPVAATIPAPADEFYDFALQESIAQIYHVYVGTRGQEAFLRARLLPETDQVQPNYLNGTRLGMGLFIVEFVRSGAAPYRSSQVEFCMVDNGGTPFFCQTFPAVKEW